MCKLSLLLMPLLCWHAAPAQQILLTKAQVLKLPCKILKNAAGNVTYGYFNDKDSSLYGCGGNFKQTLPGGYTAVDDFACPVARPAKMLERVCHVGYLSSITFTPGSLQLGSNAKAVLASAAILLSLDSACGIKVAGYMQDTAKKERQLGWDRVNTVIKYLVEELNVPAKNIGFSFNADGPANVMDLLPLTLDAPPAPKKPVKAK